MEIAVALATGIVTGCSVYLVLSRHLIRVAIGFVLFSTAANIAIFLSGRLGPMAPPVVEAGAGALAADAANPLPQALVLTAIVIGFGLVAFTLVLLLKGFIRLGTVDADDLRETDRPDNAPAAVRPAEPRREAA
ncbi:sodium:proton antiporter [Arenibaculum pallidiluteum]|uniref:sodium:proton antiporter n=1 Tax=Arenibaculum pallidiluteum TaxID=2812559 RepID=UPI001A957C29|nr:NADH-quinone oxidoreductase subunit K [Arenibaculum pallidiluteum]